MTREPSADSEFADSTGKNSPEKPIHLDDGDGERTCGPRASEDLRSSGDLAAFVAEHDLVLVDLYTKGCTLCQAIEPIVGNVARATEAAVGMLNPKDDLEPVETYDVRSVPTMLLFEDGELVGRLAHGFQETEAVVAFVESRGEV